MSAYIVNDSTISAILQAVFNAEKRHCGLKNPFKVQDDPEAYHYVMNALLTAQAQANMLMAENVRSVNWRYRNSPHIEQSTFVGNVVINLSAEPVSVLQALKLIDCLAYQSCECDDWEKTEAFALLNKFREQLIPALPGYDNEKWGL
ncbi:hypothetical protein D3C75_751810 [compost metagenome]